jgi:hypothetical protein
MVILHRLAAAARAFIAVGRETPARAPELWCRPATVLALRDRRRAGACVAGWKPISFRR